MQRLMIAIVDTLAHDIVGPITLHKNAVTAMRMWDDVCRMERSAIAQHVADHELRCVGYLEDESKDWQVSPANDVLITGQQWLASQQEKN